MQVRLRKVEMEKRDAERIKRMEQELLEMEDQAAKVCLCGIMCGLVHQIDCICAASVVLVHVSACTCMASFMCLYALVYCT